MADATLRLCYICFTFKHQFRRNAPQYLRAKKPWLPIIDPDRRALLCEHRGQKRYGEIPQLTNAKVHRHSSATPGIHATPPMKTPDGGSLAVQTGRKVEKWRIVELRGAAPLIWRTACTQKTRAAGCGSNTSAASLVPKGAAL